MKIKYAKIIFKSFAKNLYKIDINNNNRFSLSLVLNIEENSKIKKCNDYKSDRDWGLILLKSDSLCETTSAMINLINLHFIESRRLTLKLVALLKRKTDYKKKISWGILRDQDLPLRDRRQGWKHEGQGAPRGRGASCCVSRFQLILFGRLTCSTLSGAPSPWRHDPDKFPDRLPRNTRWYSIIVSIYDSLSQF